MLEQEAKAVKARMLEKILTENFTAQELAEIGRKYFTYELCVNGKKIDSSNAQMNVTDSCLEIVINEFVGPGGFPARILKECSIFYPNRNNRTGVPRCLRMLIIQLSFENDFTV